MSLPFLTASGKYDPVRAIGQKRERTVGQWGGLDERLIIEENAFSAMKNMSTRFFPAIATRLPRGAAQKTITKPHGLYWKNHLFYVSGTQCYFDGEAVSGMTVTDGDKQIVGMGAYIIVFPDKKVFNTATGEVTVMDATYTPGGTVTFSELSTDSVYCKITAAGIDDVFKAHDGVKIAGVNDDQFQVDGEPATKVITEIGDDYIVVTAPMTKSFTGTVIMIASGSNTQISGERIDQEFKANDVVKVIGSLDDDLNVSGKKVLSVSSGLIVIEGSFPAKSCTQTAPMVFSPYYDGSDKTKISGTNLGSSFKEGDIVMISGCTNPAYNKALTVRMAGTNYILVDGTLTAAFTQNSGLAFNRIAYKHDGMVVKRTGLTVASGITFSRTSPDIDYVCEHDNRLWGCSSLNHEIYASKLGDPTNWSCYEGISTDSYTVTVGSPGDFTGCVSHMGYVIFFKEDSIHMMYGNKPSNYQLNTRQMPGIRKGCAASATIVNETLYYVGRNGVYQFDGAMPQKISGQITSELSDAVGCHQDGKLYISCLKDGKRTLLTYTPQYQIWCQEDDTQFKYAAYGEGKLYFIDAANALRTISGADTGTIDWSIESGDLRESLLDQKYISKARFNLWMDAGSEANIYFRYDEDPLWHRAGTVHSVKEKAYIIPIIPRRCGKFRWKIEGKGQAKLVAMGITVEGGSEINGTVQSWYRR